MHRLRILLTTALLFAATSAAVFAQGVEPGQSFTGKVTSVIDGDTYKVDRPVGPVVKVRLWGVDAPETAQPYGTAATRAARHLVGGETVRAHVEEIGRYGRAVASLEVQGSDLGALLNRRGLGWWYRKYASRETEYARLQRQARNAGRGLWSQSDSSDPVPPWTWRSRTSDSSEELANERNCSDFDTQPEAQRFFGANQPGDPHGLDGNGDVSRASGIFEY